MSAKIREGVKCEGRFHELREFMYNDVLPVVTDRTLITRKDLEDTWSLMQDDIWGFDQKDPYYSSKRDTLRKEPPINALSLIPLIESPAYSLEKGCVWDYGVSMGNSDEISNKLESMGRHPLRFFRETLGKEPKTVIFPRSEQNLSDYIITADIGIGTITRGGISGGGVRSDSPFLLEVHHQENRGELNLVAVVGFWAQDDEMLVSQMQSCRNARFPEGVKLGEGCLYLAEVAAREMGFKKITTYGAREHPIFHEHPEDWDQMGRDFVCMYDNSAKNLGYNGGRHSHHTKILNNH